MITPNEHGIAVLILTGIALVLFTRDKIPLETSCLIVLIALVSGFQFFLKGITITDISGGTAEQYLDFVLLGYL